MEVDDWLCSGFDGRGSVLLHGTGCRAYVGRIIWGIFYFVVQMLNVCVC